MDGANLNALVGLARPGWFGADVSHLNLHKTFCIPHGGGGPGVGPVGVRAHLIPFLPGHPVLDGPALASISPLAGHAEMRAPAPPWHRARRPGGSSALRVRGDPADLLGLPAADGPRGPAPGDRGGDPARQLRGQAARPAFPGAVHRPRRAGGARVHPGPEADHRQTGITAEDVAKRLIDYGFHAPTMSFPVAGTLMVEPTESEDLVELDRFCDAMISISGEIEKVAAGEFDSQDNPLKNAPHTASMLISGDWKHGYERELAAYPAAGDRRAKYWPPVRRIDAAYGDRHLVCACPPPEAFET